MAAYYFTTYPLIFISMVALVFFGYAIFKASGGTKIDPEDAVVTNAEIIDIRSSSGENSGFINVVIQVKFTTRDMKTILSEGDAVIDVVKLPQYQNGTIIPIIYSRIDPQKVKLKIPSPLVK